MNPESCIAILFIISCIINALMFVFYHRRDCFLEEELQRKTQDFVNATVLLTDSVLESKMYEQALVNILKRFDNSKDVEYIAKTVLALKKK